ncbi:acyl-CoA thioesterase [Alkalitalea saponilacus]|uniref:Acyl-CoA thioester hydrolase n=1 Tax=Alkalitalea saponilacus TaxID=889453 RepID=A0A1T5HS83_9BACT|nr:thioesterase family protein [Alkalitalea saponilacus]ASB50006.1 thioesterase [Alkalitalea saponilacus]SKC23482.1 acyl-CoA thioester hydrolase [Alkalitalea saponilacus]
MLKDTLVIRPRYNEVDQMGYVYHANYVTYCHQARTELLRKYGVNDCVLEENGVMLPVIEMNLKYHCPAHYDAPLTITTIAEELPVTRFSFRFEFHNEKGQMICSASSTVVFVDSQTRKPMRAPEFVLRKLEAAFNT